MKAAISGGGLIGGRSAARFLLNGGDVAVFDPDPRAAERIGQVLDNARRVLPALYDRALPPEGQRVFQADLAGALAGADWVQESVSERPALKHAVYAEAAALVESLDMHPLVLRKEIDAFIGNRFQEAVWREALWMVNDDIATTWEIDEVIRLSFGPRCAQMGLSETDRLSGGAEGSGHYLAQFGPSLAWPWSRLTEVPELDAVLTAKIAAQSETQSGA